ncbi:MAG: M56 family metallopeptidase [Candidatus Sumerlaeaceae bacterium]
MNGSGNWNSWAIQASWQLALFVGAIALLALLCRNCSARLRHALWLLVLLKVFLPPGLSAPWSIGSYARDYLPEVEPPLEVLTRPEPREQQPLLAQAQMDSPATAYASSSVSASSPVAETGALSETAAQKKGLMPQWTRPQWLFAGWGFGIAAYLTIVAIPYLLLTRKLRLARRIEEGPLAVQFQQLALRFCPMRRTPALLISEHISSPFLCGLLRPRVVLPPGSLTELTPEQLENVLLHELTHWHRRDVLVGWLQVAAQALFWFHPLMWFANARLREERENACDEQVIVSGYSEPRSYADSLLKVLLASRGRSSASPGFLGIFERSTRLQHRLQRILKQEQQTRTLGAWGYGVIVAAAVLLIPMAATRRAIAETTATTTMTSSESTGGTADSLLNETQRAYVEWTIRQFGPDPDPSRYDASSDAEKQEMENRWLTIVEGPEGPEVHGAISGLAALRSKTALQPLLRIASERREKNNRGRWMAIRALSLLGDKSVVPDLIHLSYHPNQNTRMWAQIALVRLTGQNFGYEWQKWGDWWNAQGGNPPFKDAKVQWMERPEDQIYMDTEKQQQTDREFLQKYRPQKVETAISAESPTSGTMAAGPFAWQSTEPYEPPNFDKYFPDDKQASARLIERWKTLKDPFEGISDGEILQMIRQGLRGFRLNTGPDQVIRDLGNQYIWNKRPQNPEAIEIMYHASDFRGANNTPHTRGWAVYFGLSVVKPKTPAILRTLVDLCIVVDDPNDLSRVAWGARDQEKDLLKHLEPYLSSSDATVRTKAQALRKIFRDELNAFSWYGEFRKERAQRLYADKLPEYVKKLREGNSKERLETFRYLHQEGIGSLLDPVEALEIYTVCANDADSKVRKEIAIQAGGLAGYLAHMEVEGETTASEPAKRVLDLLFVLSRDPEREVRYYAVYSGLSTMTPKPEPVVRRLLEIAFEDREHNMFSRITWGLRGEKEKVRLLLDAYIAGDDPKKAAAAREIYDAVLGSADKGKATTSSATQVSAVGARDAAPRIVSTLPPVGATDVDPATTAIVVTFDRDMAPGYSWTGSENYPPSPNGKGESYWQDKRTCVKPVQLEAGNYYRVGINSTSYQNFRSVDGTPADPSAIYFTTHGASDELKAKVRKPGIVSINPPDGATDVDPARTEIVVTFDVPMGSGFSWTGGGDNFPGEVEGKRPSWSADKKNCTLPVSLKPAHEYRLGLNSVSYKNFTSEGGVALEPVEYRFSTRVASN